MYTNKTLQKTHILDNDAKTNASWLFDITDTGDTTHYWSNKTKTWNGNSYTYKIAGFTGIEMGGGGAESGIISPSKTSFKLINSGNTLSTSDYEGADIVIRAPMKANLGALVPPGDEWQDTLDTDDEQEAEMRSWGFECTRAISINQEMTLYCRSWLDKYLQGDYPNTPLIQDLWPSDDTNEKRDSICVPKIWGTAFIPIRSAQHTDDVRYYILGPDTPTYTIDKIKVPKEFGKSEFENGTYDLDNSGSFYTITGSDGVDYKATKFIIDDVDKDGTADASGHFIQGTTLYDPYLKYYRSDTSSLTNPAYVIENVLEDFGVPSAKIDDDSVAAAAAIFASWGLTFNGGLWYKRDRTDFLNELCLQCHMRIIVREKLYFKVLDKTPVLALEKHYMKGQMNQSTGQIKDNYRCTPINYDDRKDSGYVAYQQDDKPTDTLQKILVPAKSNTDHISNTTYEMPFVHDSQHVQKLGQLALQRKVLRHSEHSQDFMSKVMRCEVQDVITINPTDYGGPFNAVIEWMKINPDFSINMRFIRFSQGLDNWGDLAPNPKDIAADATQNAFRPVICGPDTPGQTGFNIPNALPGRLRIGTSGNYIMLDPHEPVQEFYEGGVCRLKIGDLGTEDYGLEIFDHNGNSIFKLDGSGNNTLCGWDVDKAKIYNTNTLIHSSGYISFGATPPTSYGNNVGAWLGYSSGAKLSFYSDANNYFKWTGSSISIASNSASAIDIKGGGDIVLEGSDDDPGYVKLNGSTYGTVLNCNTNGSCVGLTPNSGDVVSLYLGGGPWYDYYYKDIYAYAKDTITISAYDSGNSHVASIYHEIGGTYSKLDFDLWWNSAQGGMTAYKNASVEYFAPQIDKGVDLGQSSYAWKAFYCAGVIIRASGTIQPASMADGSAENDSIYYSTTQSKLVYKDSGGSVNNLY